MEIDYGAQVLDTDENILGVVDYLVRDTWTGKIRKFKVRTEVGNADLFFSPEDVIEATPDKVKINFSSDEWIETS